LLSKGRIVLLDEPEAFLHPAQARQLGLWIANQAAGMSSQLMIATHNANFLAGILQAGQPVDIFRMSRKDDVTSYKRMKAEATKDLSTSAVLSSQRVLEAIFFRGVVICEADADRSVYQTVAARDLGTSEALFVHAHNKQTIPTVAELLRGAQIPFCAIVDIDALNSKDDFEKLAASTAAPTSEIEGWLTTRQKIADSVTGVKDEDVLKGIVPKVEEFVEQLKAGKHTLAGARSALQRLRDETTAWREIKLKGLEGVPKEVRADAKRLLEELAVRGLFLVPVGELEGWIDLGTRRKKEWIVRALTALHATPAPEQLQDFVRSALGFLEIAGALSETAETAKSTDISP
jgi:hypothetical protein